MQSDKKLGLALLLQKYWKYSIGIPLIAGGFLFFKPSSKTQSNPQSLEAAVVVKESPDQVMNSKVAPSAIEDNAAAVPAPPSFPDSAVAGPVDLISREEQQEYRRQLDRFSDLQDIALKTKHEKDRMKEWFRDSEMIRSTARFLSGTPESLDESTMKMHQEATEFLIEAVKDNSEFAIEAVLNVLKNPNLENPAISKAVRQLLAESQAELLYETVPTVRAVSEYIRNQASPTQKAIYNNIHEIYQQNLKESQAELARK